MHWIKADYIQEKRTSNIGLLLGTYNAVDLNGTRTALEGAVDSEIGRHVKLDLKLRRTKYKSKAGRNVTTNIFSVSVDSRQVSEAVKGLRAILNKSFLPPTGRKLSFISRTTEDPVIQKKNEKLLAQHHENVVNERKLFRKIGVPLTAKVIMKNGNVQSLQQALGAISGINGDPLFTGVEKMGRTDTSLFTTHKNNLREGT